MDLVDQYNVLLASKWTVLAVRIILCPARNNLRLPYIPAFGARCTPAEPCFAQLPPDGQRPTQRLARPVSRQPHSLQTYNGTLRF